MNTQDNVTEYFSRDPNNYAKEYGRETAEGYSFRIRKVRLLEMLSKGTGKVLDIGCGPAVMTKEIIDLGWTYDGIDISDSMIREAQKQFLNPKAHFSVGNVNKLNTPDNTYDAIIAMGLVEYLEDDERAILEMKRVLKPSGRVLISLPNWWSPARMWDRWILAPVSRNIKKMLGKEIKQFPQREYRPGAYGKLLEKNGFGDIRIVAYNFRVVPRPFDLWLGRFSVLISKILEPLRKTPLWFLGTGVIIEAKKK